MSSDQGKFVWYELMTSDTSAAEAFYGKVVGWKTRDAGLPGKAYTLLTAGAADVGGVMKLPADAATAGARPGWIGYIAVDDVDAESTAVARAGGRTHRDPDDIPGVGRFAVVADPQGTSLVLFQPAAGEGSRLAPPGAPGHVGWHELYAVNGAEAFAFYSKFFGWTKGEALDMGPMGIYQIFAVENRPIGGIMTKMDAMPVPFWLFYFNVEEIKAAAERVRAAGGQVAMGPHQVPGGSWIIQCIDPQGAMFALVEPHR